MIKVLDGVNVLVVLDVESLVVLVVPSELVGVKEEEVTLEVVDADELLSVIVEDVGMSEEDEEEEVTMSLEELKEVDVMLSLLPPVDSGTLWRLKRAMASSRASADTAGAKSMPKRRKPNFFMAKTDLTRGLNSKLSLYEGYGGGLDRRIWLKQMGKDRSCCECVACNRAEAGIEGQLWRHTRRKAIRS